MLWLALLACEVESPPDEPIDDTEAPEVEDEFVFAPASRADLKLKRWRQLSLDLQGALELTPDQICKETGLYDCVDLHGVPLGGLSRDNGVYEAQNRISVTTSLATERVVLQACWNRVELDREGPAVVFGELDLSGSEASDEVLDAVSTELTRRLLARDPLDEELSELRSFHAEVLTTGGANAEWAWLSCFALATSTEALLY